MLATAASKPGTAASSAVDTWFCCFTHVSERSPATSSSH